MIGVLYSCLYESLLLVLNVTIILLQKKDFDLMKRAMKEVVESRLSLLVRLEL